MFSGNPYIDLYSLALAGLNRTLRVLHRLEKWVVDRKVDVIRRLHGEQSTWGW